MTEPVNELVVSILLGRAEHQPRNQKQRVVDAVNQIRVSVGLKEGLWEYPCDCEPKVVKRVPPPNPVKPDTHKPRKWWKW